MVGQHHRLNGHEFEQAPGDGEEQGSLACRQGHKDSDMTQRLNNNNMIWIKTVIDLCDHNYGMRKTSARFQKTF